MSDEDTVEPGTSTGATIDSETELYERGLPIADVDWLLESMVADANHSGTYGVPVTLLTRGGAVTGVLISMQEYAQAAGEWWVRAAGEAPSYGGQMKDYLDKVVETETDRLKDANESEFNYIHLKEVRHIGSLVIQEPGLLWRGRLSEVTGFALGALSPKPVTFTMTTKRG